MKLREVIKTDSGDSLYDSDGASLERLIGSDEIAMIDPFLLLDKFATNKRKDSLDGFPPHPHRGFETVTYMIEGRMRHRDNTGREGVVSPGGVQWMTAASGIIHS